MGTDAPDGFLYANLREAYSGAGNGRIDANVESDATAAHLALENALTRVIDARKSEAAYGVVSVSDRSTGVVIEHTPRAKERVIEHEPRAFPEKAKRFANSFSAEPAADGRSQTPAPEPRVGEPQTPAATRAETRIIEHEFTAGDGRREPRDSGSTDNVQTPRAAVPAQPRQLSSTELFYEYHGTRRP